MENPTRPVVVISTDAIIGKINSARNEFIEALLKGSGIADFMEAHFDTVIVSKIKLEFLTRDLKTLKSESLDLVHYSSLIKYLKETGSTDVDPKHVLIRQEVFTIFKRYGIE